MAASSLFEMLTFSFSGELPLEQVSERDQLILSVMDNMQRIINCRAGTLAHLPDYGLPDLSMIHQGMTACIHGLIHQIEDGAAASRILMKGELIERKSVCAVR